MNFRFRLLHLILVPVNLFEERESLPVGLKGLRQLFLHLLGLAASQESVRLKGLVVARRFKRGGLLEGFKGLRELVKTHLRVADLYERVSLI